jgi:GT2 family glycosyltransferase
VLGDPSRPLTTGSRGWVGGNGKWETLGRTSVLLNIHRDDEPYFEWLRAVQAISNGAVIVSDSSVDVAPLVPGEHFFEGPKEDLGLIADLLLDDPERVHAVSSAAYELLVESLRLSDAVEQLADVCQRRSKGRASAPAITVAEDDLHPLALSPEYNYALHSVNSVEADALLRIEARMGHYLREQKLLTRELQGDVQRLDTMLRTNAPVPKVELVYRSPAFDGVRPRVSVVTPLFNYERMIGAALTSAASSDLREIELIVVDDGSTDGSLAAAERWMRDHPDIPALLLRHPINRGLGQARNTAVGAARGEFVFLLDADNSVYPSGIRRLVQVIEDDPEAAFAWGYLQTHDPDFQPVGVLSSFGWEPTRFGNGNYIDAMVLWRRSALLEWGLYTTDSDLYGWEDFELFARVAEGGGRGVMTPQFVARYRLSGLSMLRTANMAHVAMTRQLIEMYPTAMGGRSTSGSG